MDFSSTIYILIIPFAVFVLLGVFYNKIKPAISGWIGVTGLAMVAVISYTTAIRYFLYSPKTSEGAYQTFYGFKTTWMRFTDTLSIDMGILIDPISVMMLVVVSTI